MHHPRPTPRSPRSQAEWRLIRCHLAVVATGAGVVLALLALGIQPATAEIRVVVRPDGTRFLYNEGASGAGTGAASRGATPLTVSPRTDYSRLIVQHAQRANLDPRLVRAVVQVESGYNPKARSRKGAMGLMQLMPQTAREMGVRDAYDPAQNLRGGTRYLRRMIDRFGGDLELALAGYNAGPTAVERYGRIPPYRETVDYVRRVLGLYRSRGGRVSSALSGTPGQGRAVVIERDQENGILLRTED